MVVFAAKVAISTEVKLSILEIVLLVQCQVLETMPVSRWPQNYQLVSGGQGRLCSLSAFSTVFLLIYSFLDYSPSDCAVQITEYKVFYCVS